MGELAAIGCRLPAASVKVCQAPQMPRGHLSIISANFVANKGEYGKGRAYPVPGSRTVWEAIFNSRNAIGVDDSKHPLKALMGP